VASPIVIRYVAPPTIAEFMSSDLFVRGLMGPFGSGKSSGCANELHRRAREQKPGPDGIRRTRWAVIRNTYGELRDTTRKTFEEWIPGQLGTWSEQDFTFTMKYGDVEAEFLFRALDRPEDVKKLLSLELTGAWINEAREVELAVFRHLLGRIRRYPSMRQGGPTWSGVIMDTNPPDDDSWWYKLFEETSLVTDDISDSIAIFKQPGGMEPDAENLDHLEGGRDYYTKLMIINASDPIWVKVHVHAQYGPTMAGKPIYPEFRDAVHVDPGIEANPKSSILLGMDFGLTPAMVFAQRDPRDSQYQVFDEMCADNMGAISFAESAAAYIRRMYPGRHIAGHGDPAGDQRSQADERTPFDVVNSQGIPLSPAHTNDFTLRREAVGRSLQRLTILGRPALVIHPRCKVLRKAMNGGYCYKRVASSGSEKFRDKPEKNKFSHVAEALQYMMVGEGEDSRVLESSTESRRVSDNFKVLTNTRRRR
jgi:hypothetical protein